MKKSDIQKLAEGAVLAKTNKNTPYTKRPHTPFIPQLVRGKLDSELEAADEDAEGKITQKKAMLNVWRGEGDEWAEYKIDGTNVQIEVWNLDPNASYAEDTLVTAQWIDNRMYVQGGTVSPVVVLCTQADTKTRTWGRGSILKCSQKNEAVGTAVVYEVTSKQVAIINVSKTRLRVGQEYVAIWCNKFKNYVVVNEAGWMYQFTGNNQG